MVEHARAVIIGGGVGGTSIAYHLTELGWTDVILVDRAELTSGSTFHSAGLVGQLRSSVTLTKMMMYGSDLYRRLAAETPRGTRSARCGWRPARSGSRSFAARPAGPRRSACRWS
jgi:4-methylaminobutanoate oxidase (formaldehyde-forming)